MRTPITLKIKFKSSSLDQFIERYSVDVSRGGIFIRTKEPLAVGTTLRFEFQLQDGSSLIGGEGTVVWNRAYDPSRSGVAPGMGVRFDKLTADSQRVLERILGEKHKRGEAQLESRFDAGVRASREAKAQDFNDQGTPLPPAAPGLSGAFGDEPTRMMAADQVSQLAEAMQREDSFAQEQPTRRASMEEIQKAVAGQASAHDHPGVGRTGRTSEHVRLGSSVATPPGTRGAAQAAGLSPMSRSGARITSMGMVSPVVAAGAQPSSETPLGAPEFSPDESLPPSLSTRPVTAEQAAALIALSHSAHTPPRSPETPIITTSATSVPSGPVGGSGRSGPAVVTHPGFEPSAATPPLPAGADPSEPATIPVIAVNPSLLNPRASARSAPLFPDAASTLASDRSAVAALAAGADESGEHQPMTTTLVGVGAPSSLFSAPPPEAPPPSARSAPREPAGAAPAGASPAADDGGSSNLSLTIPGVPGIDVELPQESPATPLDPEAFAPPPVARTPEPPAPAMQPLTQPSALPAPPTNEPGGRAPWLLIILVLAVIVTGTIVYALYSARRGSEGSQPPQNPPTVTPTPPRPTPVEPAVKPTPVKPAESGDKGDKDPAEAKDPVEAGAGPQKPGTGEPAGEPEKGEAKPGEEGLSVAVSSEPTGAKVELNGQAVGTTPAQLKGLAAGKSYDLHLSLRGYQDYKGKLKAAAGMKPLALKLTAYERVVEVLSTPKNAEVFLDDKKVGRTPYSLRKLDLSKVHKVEIRRTGYAPQTRNISETQDFAVKNGKEVLRLEVTLEPAAEKTEPKTEAKPEPKADVKPAQKPDGVAAPKRPATPRRPPAEAKPEAKGDTKAEPAVEKTEPKADTKADTKADPKPEPKADDKAGKSDENTEAK